MTAWPNSTSSPMELLGFALLHSVWQIALIGAMSAWLLRISSIERIRYRIAFGGLIAMFFAPLICFLAMLSIVPVTSTDSRSTSAASPAGTSQTGLSADSVFVLAQATDPQPQLVDGILATPTIDIHDMEASSDGIQSGEAMSPRPQRSDGYHIVVWLGPLWLIGVVFLSGRRAGGWLLAHRTVRLARPVEDLSVLDRVAKLSRQISKSASIRILQSERVRSPMVIGVLRPCILVPTAFLTGLTPDQQSAILAHELAHLRRNDFLQNLIQTAIETVLFYHPAAWWMSSQVRRIRENLCDDWSLSVVGKPICLAEALSFIQAACAPSTKRPDTAIALGQAAEGGGEHDTLRRVRRILGSDPKKTASATKLRPGQTGTPQNLGKPILGLSLLIFFSAASTLALLAPGFAAAMQQIQAVEADEVETSGSDATDTGNLGQDETDNETVSTPEPIVESWEISRLYEPAFLRAYLRDHEALPKPIKVPSIRGKILDPGGNPVVGASIVSHTPRHWVNLKDDLGLQPHNSGGIKKTNQDGKFGVPERSEPYRVLVVHESGVANVSHEELIRADGSISLRPWPILTGTLIVNGKPLAGEKITAHFNTLPWSYSRGGPRLTTDHNTVTDENGKFVFLHPLPLSGMIHHISKAGMLSRGVAFDCTEGKTTDVTLGTGRTLRGQVRIPKGLSHKDVTVRACRTLLAPPYPPGLSSNEKRDWLLRWNATRAGQTLGDENYVRMNSDVYGIVDADGSFVIHGVATEEEVRLTVFARNHGVLFETVLGAVTEHTALDLGPLAGEHDHDHESIKDEKADAKLPKLIVHAVDSDGKAIPDATVQFYDRHSFRVGMEGDFERISKKTNEKGVAELGPMPQIYGCVELRHKDVKKYSQCYTVLAGPPDRVTQASPHRSNVRLRQTDNELHVTVVMTPHVDLEFKIIDDQTGEIVFWPELFYQSPETKAWWMIALVDGSQRQHNFIPITPEICKLPIRISTAGYETQWVQLPDDTDLTAPIRKTVRLKPLAKIQWVVTTPDGNPAAGARVSLRYAKGLDSVSNLGTTTDAQGNAEMDFPPSSDLVTIDIVHPSGTYRVKGSELKKVVREDKNSVVRYQIQLQSE